MRRLLPALLLLATVALHAQTSCPVTAPVALVITSPSCGSVCLAGNAISFMLQPLLPPLGPPPPFGVPPSGPVYQIQACDQVAWDFGDGSQATVTGTGLIQHTYSSGGSYRPAVTITNSLGSVHTAALNPIMIGTNPPVFVEFSPSEITVPETAGSITFTLVRSGNLSVTSTVHYAHVEYEGPWSQGEVIAGDLTFSPGETTKNFTMRVYDNHSYRTGVWGSVTARANDGTLFRFDGTPNELAVAYYNLTEVDPPPSASVADVRVREGAETADFTVTLSAPMGLWATFYTSLADGTAKAGTDYGAAPPTCAIPPGSTQCTLRVPLVDNAVPGPDKTFTISFIDIGADAPTYARRTATCTIVNDDAPITPVTSHVAAGTQVPLRLDVGQPQASPLTIPLQSSSPDVVEVPPSVTIPAGQSSVSFTAHAAVAGRSRITATIPGMTAPPATINVVDPVTVVAKPSALALRPGSDGAVAVSLQPPRGVMQAVSLWSTRPEIATVPESLTIPAGGSATLNVHAVADGVASIGIGTSDGAAFNVDVVVADSATVSRIEPASGPASGGTTVTLIGDGLDARCSVSFGGVAATNVTRAASGLAVVIPAHDPGAVDVSVICGGSKITLPDAFTFFVPRRRAAG